MSRSYSSDNTLQTCLCCCCTSLFGILGENEGSATAVPVSSVVNGTIGEVNTVKQGYKTCEGRLIHSSKKCVSLAVHLITCHYSKTISRVFVQVTVTITR